MGQAGVTAVVVYCDGLLWCLCAKTTKHPRHQKTPSEYMPA
jgi:hypothetical protein